MTWLAVLALAGAFVAAWARGLPFSAPRLIGIMLLSGGAVGAATNLAGAHVPLWNALAPDAPFDLFLKATAALVIGLGLHLIVSFKSKEAIKPEQE
ncbi:MAG: hypothetical protein R8G34_08225 [Paracoccaceae bacterium]|nr:hypothetical protein [Paracoccaceae bacterium]